jgi:Tfp pilus assembly protein PilF
MKSAILALLLFSTASVFAQERSQDDQPHITPKNQPKPQQQQQREEDQAAQPQQGESSSKDSQIDLSSNTVTKSGSNTQGPETPGSETPNDVQEMRPWDPHKAAKDVEVGEYYLKQKNYRAALDRFNEALLYKPKDADATFHLAETQEKLELFTKAYENYSLYLEIVPKGPQAGAAHDALRRLDPRVEDKVLDPHRSPELQQLLQQGETALGQNDFQSAYVQFSKALQIAPDDALANFHLAESLQGLQRLEEARLFYQKCVALQPHGIHVSEARRQITEINYTLGK